MDPDSWNSSRKREEKKKEAWAVHLSSIYLGIAEMAHILTIFYCVYIVTILTEGDKFTIDDTNNKKRTAASYMWHINFSAVLLRQQSPPSQKKRSWLIRAILFFSVILDSIFLCVVTIKAKMVSIIRIVFLRFSLHIVQQRIRPGLLS